MTGESKEALPFTRNEKGSEERIRDLVRRVRQTSHQGFHKPFTQQLLCLSSNPFLLTGGEMQTGAHGREIEAVSYLSLRAKQDEDLSADYLKAGVEHAKAGQNTEAERKYKQGLELVPNKPDILVAYGALCANSGRIQEAKLKLQQALKEDPNCANAYDYLVAIEEREQGLSRPSTPRSKAFSCLHPGDAMCDATTRMGRPCAKKRTNDSFESTSYSLLAENSGEKEEPIIPKDKKRLKSRKKHSLPAESSRRSRKKHRKR